jgi:hypothetical protein
MPTSRKKGRPPKFEGPRLPVTVTLPESTLSKLAAISGDRARAIVKAVAAAVPDRDRASAVELLDVGPRRALLVVPQCPALSAIPGLRLVEISPGRFIITFPSGTSIESLEVALLDALEAPLPHPERMLLSEVRERISAFRRLKTVSKAEILVVASK